MLRPIWRTAALRLGSLERAGKAATLDLPPVERQLKAKLEEWKAVLRKHVPQTRQVLKTLLAGPLVFTAYRESGERYYEFSAPIAIGRIISGLACANTVASPAGTVEGCRAKLLGIAA